MKKALKNVFGVIYAIIVLIFAAISILAILVAWAYTFWEAAKMAGKIFPSEFLSVPFWGMSIARIFNFLVLSLFSAFVLILGIVFVPLCVVVLTVACKAGFELIHKAGFELTHKAWEESERESVEKAAERSAKNSAEYDLLNKVFGKKTGKK